MKIFTLDGKSVEIGKDGKMEEGGQDKLKEMLADMALTEAHRMVLEACPEPPYGANSRMKDLVAQLLTRWAMHRLLNKVEADATKALDADIFSPPDPIYMDKVKQCIVVELRTMAELMKFYLTKDRAEDATMAAYNKVANEMNEIFNEEE